MKVQDQNQIKPNTQSCQTSVIASTVYLQDCVEGMKRFPDNYFDLAIVDPPYGIGNKLVDGGGTRKAKFDNKRDSVKWDIVPTKEYWNEWGKESPKYAVRYVVLDEEPKEEKSFEQQTAEVVMEMLYGQLVSGCYSEWTCGYGDFDYVTGENGHSIFEELQSSVGKYLHFKI